MCGYRLGRRLQISLGDLSVVPRLGATERCLERAQVFIQVFIKEETECCPFFAFEVEERNDMTLVRVFQPGGSVWARLRECEFLA